MAYDVFALFATDEKKELEGTVIPLAKGVSMTIARMGNERYQAKMIEAAEENLEAVRSLPKKEAEAFDLELHIKVMAETILVGFTGMSYKGKPIKYSVENAVKLLRLPEFRKVVVRHASRLENFLLAQEAADEKNS